MDKYLQYQKFIISERGFINHLRKPNFRVEHDVLSYRIIRTWVEYGLLDDTRKSAGAWRKFSLLELVWLKIIRILRDYGYPLSKIMAAKFSLYRLARQKSAYHLDFGLWRITKSKEHIILAVLKEGNAIIGTREEVQKTVDNNEIHDFLSIDLTKIVKEDVEEINWMQ